MYGEQAQEISNNWERTTTFERLGVLCEMLDRNTSLASVLKIKLICFDLSSKRLYTTSHMQVESIYSYSILSAVASLINDHRLRY